MTQTITNTEATDDILPIVESALQNIRNIATLPVVAVKIIGCVEDPESRAEDISELIVNDPAMSTRILKIVNSSFYGLSRQIGSIDRAVVLLGLNAVKNIAIAASLCKVFRPAKIGPDFDARDLWTHSIAVATGAREVAIKARFDLPDEAFLAGLIHDVGIMVEIQACREKFVEVIQLLSDEPDLAFREAEERILGATHESFGAALCKKWKFPTAIEYAARFHHEPMQLPEFDRLLPAIVHVADILAARIGSGYTRTVETQDVDSQLLDSLNLDEIDVETIEERLPEAIEETQHLLSDNGVS